MTNWSKYDYCEHCDAPAGKPCRDLRYKRDGGQWFAVNRPHPRRPWMVV